LSLSIIAALDKNNLIGNEGTLPWHIPEDLAWFKEQTMGKTVVMGRKTWLSIGKPLSGRRNIILTNSPDFTVNGAEIMHSVSEVLAMAENEEVFIIGGAEIFKQALPHAEKLYISHIDDTFNGNTYFPAYNKAEWCLMSQSITITKHNVRLSFNIYTRSL
jgi:dihydrofolate reductase